MAKLGICQKRKSFIIKNIIIHDSVDYEFLSKLTGYSIHEIFVSHNFYRNHNFVMFKSYMERDHYYLVDKETMQEIKLVLIDGNLKSNIPLPMEIERVLITFGFRNERIFKN